MFDDRFFRGDFLKIRSQSSIVTRLTKKTQCSTATRCDDDEFTHKQTLTSAPNQTTDDDDKKAASIDI